MVIFMHGSAEVHTMYVIFLSFLFHTRGACGELSRRWGCYATLQWAKGQRSAGCHPPCVIDWCTHSVGRTLPFLSPLARLPWRRPVRVFAACPRLSREHQLSHEWWPVLLSLPLTSHDAHSEEFDAQISVCQVQAPPEDGA